MAWLTLIVAGVFEVVWAGALKASNGFARPGATILFVVALAISMGLLGLSLRWLPLGTAYTIWTGVGAVGTVVVGIVGFGEQATPGRLVCIGLIVAGIIGLRLVTPG